VDRLTEARRILLHESMTLERVAARLDEAFGRAVDLVLECQGNVVVSGVGKPYIVAQKLSASLASTGTPSIPLHPVDALHGDLGRISRRDVLLVLSNSGASQEIVELLPTLARVGAPLIAITGNPRSPLGSQANAVLDLGPIEEPCHMGLTPTSSTTAMMGVGDALTLVVAVERGFSEADFARLHPGGAIGRRLQSVGQAMRPLARSAVADRDTLVAEVVERITKTRSGAAYVLDTSGVLLGIFTDGDLRRAVLRKATSLSEPVHLHMTAGPKTASPDARVSEALELMRAHAIDELPVVDDQGRLLGHLDVQDVLT
jgi:arabinose-5-phosphate isomerase